jgi:hypothetical protein
MSNTRYTHPREYERILQLRAKLPAAKQVVRDMESELARLEMLLGEQIDHQPASPSGWGFPG